ncbi:MAG TPA: hypothetical protein VKT29_02535 [Terriglobales bacterium]|nr:hypothetical protein [Terriglobales bacterium]
MKTYRSPRDLNAEIEKVLKRRPNLAVSPLDKVAEILSDGRHYSWLGIYLVAGTRSGGAATADNTPGKREGTEGRTVLPIRLGVNELGAIEVQAESGRTLAGEDRILLKGVAERLAKYLHGPGRYLARKAREAAAEQPATPQSRGHQPESERAQERSLAAGEGRR